MHPGFSGTKGVLLPLLFWFVGNVEAVWRLRISGRTERCHLPIRKEDLESASCYKGEAQSLVLCREVHSWVSTFISELRGPQEIGSEMPLSGSPHAKAKHWAVVSREL